MAVAGCGARRGTISIDPAAGGVGTVEPILVATNRTPATSAEVFSGDRSETLAFARFEVSVPPDRVPGTVSFPAEGTSDPRTDFLTVAAGRIGSEAAFIAAVNASMRGKPARDREAMVFVHGFNTNFAESLYRHAQMRHDFATPGLSILYAWPSAANVRAYGLDRETALFARDGLDQLLTALARADVTRIILVGHSMGALIVMDTLRQMALAGAPGVFDKLAAVVLFAPDLDTGLFRTQVRPLIRYDVPIYLFVSSRDRALRFSALLRGQADRLGSIQDASGIADLPIVLIDITNVEANADRLGHFKVATSPSMIALINGMDEVGIEIFRDEQRRPSVFETTITAVQEMTEIVLLPLTP
jgi:esterase/lipase superfamily enzyme